MYKCFDLLAQIGLQNHIPLTSVHRLEQIKKQQVGKKIGKLNKGRKTNKQETRTKHPKSHPKSSKLFWSKKKLQEKQLQFDLFFWFWGFLNYFIFLKLYRR